MHSSAISLLLLPFLSLTAALPRSYTTNDDAHTVAVDKRSETPTTYPRWLGDGDAPWNANSDTAPDSDAVRSYEFTITRGTLAPDGVSRDMFLVNGQFPGPLIEANWGDMIEVTVINKITGPEEPTSMHWHGMLQHDTPWADGVPGVSQCPIAPGSSYKYRFRAEVYGTSFYHSHYSAQYTAGIVGPMQIYGPSQQDYDIDLGPMMISDWYHAPYTTVLQNYLRPGQAGPPPMSDSGLINGKGRFNCSLVQPDSVTGEVPNCTPDAEYSTIRFQSGKLHRLRLINHGAAGVQQYSIDGHSFTVIAEDYVPVKPYSASIITLGVGQRVDVLVQAFDKPTMSVWMRSQMPGGAICGSNDNTQAIKAMVYYEDADTSIAPASISSNNEAACVNNNLNQTEPETAVAMSSDPLQLDFTLSLDISDTGEFLWKINDEINVPQLFDPLLFRDDLANGARHSTGDAKSVRLNVTNTTPIPHPFHLHGNHFQILASGPDIATSTYPSTVANPIAPPPATAWDGTVEVSTDNPPRRDVHIVPALGYAVFQFDTNNPGVWPFHCHTAWHLASGMSLNLVVRPDDIITAPEGTRGSTCNAFAMWASATGYQGLDDGL